MAELHAKTAVGDEGTTLPRHFPLQSFQVRAVNQSSIHTEPSGFAARPRSASATFERCAWARLCPRLRGWRRKSSPVRAQGRSHHAAEQYLRVALVPDDRRVIGPQPLSFRFCPLGSGGLLQKQSPGHYSFSTSTLPKPCSSASRGALRDVPTPRAAVAFTIAFTIAFSFVPALRALHKG